jgi:DNA-binding HxlR family transcriptional regulator
VRAGAQALTLLSVPLNVQVLTALKSGPKPLVELRRAAGSPPQTTLRKQLLSLTDLGILERHQQQGFPGSVEYKLSRPGRAFLKVAEAAQNWLELSPHGPHELGTQAAKSSIKALVDGWSSTIIRAFAAKPLSLTELDRLIANIPYPTLERRVGAMRIAGQIAVSARDGRTRPYAVTPWLRRGIAPLAAAVDWEALFNAEKRVPPTGLDIESAFLLSVPRLCLRDTLSGSVRLVVQFRTNHGDTRLAGVMVVIDEGEIRSCVSRLDGHADGWASGSLGPWLNATIRGQRDSLEIGGECDLARAVVDGLHESLFPPPVGAMPRSERRQLSRR